MTTATTHDWHADLALVTEAARRAGETALSYFRQSPDVWFKNEGRSPVSAADLAANKVIEDMLRAARPDYGWLSEETDDTSDRLQRQTVFVVDPIDGTRAFIAGENTWCVSIAVVDRGRPVAAALYAPALGEEFQAVVGGTPLKNGEPVSVSIPEGDRTLRVATPQGLLNSVEAGFRTTLERVSHIPSLAYRLTMVADGTIDATLVQQNSHDWDLAGADLVLECAGGRLCTLDGRPLIYNRAEVRHGTLCAAGESVLPGLLASLAGLPEG